MYNNNNNNNNNWSDSKDSAPTENSVTRNSKITKKSTSGVRLQVVACSWIHEQYQQKDQAEGRE